MVKWSADQATCAVRMSFTQSVLLDGYVLKMSALVVDKRILPLPGYGLEGVSFHSNIRVQNTKCKYKRRIQKGNC
jgi:hypothetical protein